MNLVRLILIVLLICVWGTQLVAWSYVNQLQQMDNLNGAQKIETWQ